MEAFEKYRSKAVRDLGLVPSESYDGGYLIGIKHGWRAALKWELEQREMGHCVTKRQIIPVDVIEKELEE